MDSPDGKSSWEKSEEAKDRQWPGILKLVSYILLKIVILRCLGELANRTLWRLILLQQVLHAYGFSV